MVQQVQYVNFTLCPSGEIAIGWDNRLDRDDVDYEDGIILVPVDAFKGDWRRWLKEMVQKEADAYIEYTNVFKELT